MARSQYILEFSTNQASEDLHLTLPSTMPVLDCELPTVFQEALWTTRGVSTLIDWVVTQPVYPWCIPDEDILPVLHSILDLLYATIPLPDNANHVALQIVSSTSLDLICAHVALG